MAKKKEKKVVKKIAKKRAPKKAPGVKALPDFDEKAFREERAVETLLKAEEIKQDSDLMKGVNKRLVVQKAALNKISRS